jgi:hypothetical protein
VRQSEIAQNEHKITNYVTLSCYNTMVELGGY